MTIKWYFSEHDNKKKSLNICMIITSKNYPSRTFTANNIRFKLSHTLLLKVSRMRALRNTKPTFFQTIHLNSKMRGERSFINSDSNISVYRYSCIQCL